jgi:hypothetical protein
MIGAEGSRERRRPEFFQSVDDGWRDFDRPEGPGRAILIGDEIGSVRPAATRQNPSSTIWPLMVVSFRSGRGMIDHVGAAKYLGHRIDAVAGQYFLDRSGQAAIYVIPPLPRGGMVDIGWRHNRALVWLHSCWTA